MKKKSQTDTSRGSKSSGGDKVRYAKRPMSAFFFFSQSVREDLKKSGGSVGGIENVAKISGQRWKELSAEDRKPYDKKAKEDKERYEREMASGLVPQPRKTKGDKGKKVGKAKEKDPNKPKRANSAYLYFTADFRKSPDAVGVKHIDIMRVAGEKWKKLSESERKPYLDMEQKDKDRYAKQMKEYSSKTPVAKKGAKKAAKPSRESEKESSASQSEDESHDDEDEDEEMSE